MDNVKYSIVTQTDSARILELYRQAGWWELDDNPDYLNTVANIVEHTYCFVIAELEGQIVPAQCVLGGGLPVAAVETAVAGEQLDPAARYTVTGSDLELSAYGGMLTDDPADLVVGAGIGVLAAWLTRRYVNRMMRVT